MARGRKPEPAALKRAKGNPGRRPIVDAPALPASNAVATHPGLSKDARKVWERLAPDLVHMQFLRPTDRDAFARYCEHLAKWWELTRAIRRDGETYLSKSEHNPQGLHRMNPKFMIRERIENRLELLEDRFGLTPASRQQVLQRMAMLPVSGDLFGAPKPDESGDALPGEAAQPSPVGLLARAATPTAH